MSCFENELRSRLVSFHSSFVWSLGENGPSGDQVEEWEQLAVHLVNVIANGKVSEDLLRLASTVAYNVRTYIISAQKLSAANEEAVVSLETEFRELLSGELPSALFSLISREERPVPILFEPKRRHNRRSPSPLSPYLAPSPDSPLSPRPSTPTISTPPLKELQPADHLRLWFLDHLANPYPTITEKRELSLVTGIAKNKIDSDMTNWRRRAGWTDIKDTYADRDKVKMQRLIEAVQAGKEKRTAVIEAVEKMRAYLERREEYGVGSWVYSVS